MLPSIGTPEIIIIVCLIVLLFGAPKLPELARSIGRSLRIFKSEVDEMKGPRRKKSDKDAEQIAPGVVDADAVIVDDTTTPAGMPNDMPSDVSNDVSNEQA